jgi:CBS domain-containing protein
MTLPSHLTQFLASVHPYDSLPEQDLAALAAVCRDVNYQPGESIFSIGDTVAHLYVVVAGEVDITDDASVQLSLLGPRNSFGERALLRGQRASRTARAVSEVTLVSIPEQTFFDLIKSHPPVARFFDRRRPAVAPDVDLGTMPVKRWMTRNPITCAPDTPIREAAATLRDKRISSVCVTTNEGYQGLVTLRTMSARVIADGVNPELPVSKIMLTDRTPLSPDALVMDALHQMVERRIGSIPILDDGALVGIITKTDLTRAQALTSADLVGRIAKAENASDMAHVTADIPQLLVQLVDAGRPHEVVTRLITDIADTVTRRLLLLAEEKFGRAPVPFAWLACGSQGRQEQTGVSDQDNCMILSDQVTEKDMVYFQTLARFVSDGLDACSYFYCPGDMMATNPRWCQPFDIWRDYFHDWITTPNPEAQMLASVMFDLRVIGGDATLFEDLQKETLAAAAGNSIFTAHMVANSLKHHPPLGLLRGLATIRSGDHRDTLDLKHNGVVPVVDLGRLYALDGQMTQAATRTRLKNAVEQGLLSPSGGEDLLDAYDLIAMPRLKHQAAQIRAGQKPDNYLNPSDLSDFERSHLRDAFVVVKTMQSAAGSGKGMLG